MTGDALQFGYGVALALVVPVLAFGMFGAMVPDTGGTGAGILLACAALVFFPALLGMLGFAAGKRMFGPAIGIRPLRRGAIGGAAGVVAVIALAAGFHGNGIIEIGLVLCLFFVVGVVSTFVARDA